MSESKNLYTTFDTSFPRTKKATFRGTSFPLVQAEITEPIIAKNTFPNFFDIIWVFSVAF